MSLISKILGRINESALVQTPGLPPGALPREGVFVTVKTSEPRGVPAAAIKHLAYQLYDGHSKSKVTGCLTLSGRPLKIGMSYIKLSGFVIQFQDGVSQDEAIQITRQLLNSAQDYAEKDEAARTQNRADAPARRKEASKHYRTFAAANREQLVAKYGARNVASVTARQIGGDDGYQWNVLINGRSIVNGLTYNEVPHYKERAYNDLLAQNGKV